MDILTLAGRGFSQRKIARTLGISRKTIRRYLADPKLITTARGMRPRPSKLDPFVPHLKTWLEEDPGYSATWLFEHLQGLGFAGSYEIVKRQVRRLKEHQHHIAYLRFETEPGAQAQVDFGEFQVEGPDGKITKYYAFAMILGYSRRLYAELLEQCDLATFLDCHQRAFAFFGGVPREILYDRMKNVFLGRFAGKDRFNSTLLSLALHCGFTPKVAPPRAAWVKGKIERPFHFLREGFWRGYPFRDLKTANADLFAWLAQKEQRVHGTTHEVVAVRFARELPQLKPLPPEPFDTSYRLYRKVHKDCTVRFEGNHFVVPHQLVGRTLLMQVKDHALRIFNDHELIVTYAIPAGRGHLVQDKRFYHALRHDQELNRRKYQRPTPGKGRAQRTISPLAPKYELEVQQRPLAAYHALVEAGHE